MYLAIVHVSDVDFNSCLVSSFDNPMNARLWGFTFFAKHSDTFDEGVYDYGMGWQHKEDYSFIHWDKEPFPTNLDIFSYQVAQSFWKIRGWKHPSHWQKVPVKSCSLEFQWTLILNEPPLSEVERFVYIRELEVLGMDKTPDVEINAKPCCPLGVGIPLQDIIHKHCFVIWMFRTHTDLPEEMIVEIMKFVDF